ncbi:hypothetical protein A1F99_032650 [Pyrenophora tritici-repentis]|nr:hypothetical protein A1F99_127930 [Pyrenophora tritici-repentis]KAF7448295.1 hypothetical protein A1F99_076590 [Pyrenophora tritici-repentis]KAF7451488.1 hypothetical protein A1F99_032650 [Pyrenophora tritici-repentis]
MLEDESKDLEATEIDQTKFGKMAMFEGINRPPTPYIQEEEFYKLAGQINQLLRHLNKANIEYACEEPNIMAAMRQDFYRLSLELDRRRNPIMGRTNVANLGRREARDLRRTLPDQERLEDLPTRPQEKGQGHQ